MRRLTAYREKYTTEYSSSTIGRLTISVPSLSYYTLEVLKLIGKFRYNHTDYAIVLSKEGGDEVNTANLSAIGVTVAEMVINVVATYWGNFFGSDIFFIKNSVSSCVANSLGMAVLSSEISGSNVITVLQADEPRSYKTITNISDINSSFIPAFTASTASVNVPSKVTTRYDFFDLDLDDNTAIGINYQGYDPENPTNIGFKTSNSFSIPYTSNNARLVGFCGISDDAFDPWFVNYIVDNNIIISGGKAMVTEVSNMSTSGISGAESRISLSISSKSTIWDRLKEVLWPDFMVDYFDWLETNYTTEWGSYNDFINGTVIGGHEHIILGAMHGDHHPDSEVDIIEDFAKYRSQPISTIVLNILGYNGGVFCTYVKSIFEFINVKFGINFLAGNNTTFDNVDAFFQNRYLSPKKISSVSYKIVFSKGVADINSGKYKSDKEKKTVLDFVKEFIVHTNSLVDVISDNEIELHMLNSIQQAPAVNFSGNIEKGSISYHPIIDGVAQINYIDYSEYSKKIVEKSLRQHIACENMNVESSKDYIELKEFVPPAYSDRDTYVLGLFEDGSNSNFTFLTHGSTGRTYNLKSFFDLSAPLEKSKDLSPSELLPLGYAQWGLMISKPRRFKLKKWLTSADIDRLKLFKQYWIDELNGSFMLIGISGLNPEKSKEATELEFIQITYQKSTIM